MTNVPSSIAGQPVPDRLSFHVRSAYFLNGAALQCRDMRAGCPRAGRCGKLRLRPRHAAVRHDSELEQAIGLGAAGRTTEAISFDDEGVPVAELNEEYRLEEFGRPHSARPIPCLSLFSRRTEPA